jgi:hypothetical protein
MVSFLVGHLDLKSFLPSCRAMRLLFSFLVVLVVTTLACSAPRSDTPLTSTEAVPAPADVPGVASERRVFALINEEGDTVSTDVYTRTDKALDGEVRIHLPGAKFQRARYRVEFDSTGLAIHAKLTFLRTYTPTGEPALGEFTAVLHPNGMVEEARDDGTPDWFRTGPGVVPWFPPSTATMQEIIRRAHRLTGGTGSVGIPHFPLASGGQGIGIVTITFLTPDSVELFYGPGSDPVRHPVDGHGRLLGGRIANGWRLSIATP